MLSDDEVQNICRTIQREYTACDVNMPYYRAIKDYIR